MLARLDANGDGTVSFAELLQALRAAEVNRGGAQQPPAAAMGRSSSSSYGRPPLARQASIASLPGKHTPVQVAAPRSVPRSNPSPYVPYPSSYPVGMDCCAKNWGHHFAPEALLSKTRPLSSWAYASTCC
jgi:hypothetical protein